MGHGSRISFMVMDTKYSFSSSDNVCLVLLEVREFWLILVLALKTELLNCCNSQLRGREFFSLEMRRLKCEWNNYIRLVHSVTVSNIVINTHSSQAFRMSTNELSSSSGSQDFRQSLVSRRGLVLRNFNILLTLSRDWSAGFCQSQQKNVNCLQSDGDFHTDLMNDLQPRSSSTRGAWAQVRLSGDGSCDVH